MALRPLKTKLAFGLADMRAREVISPTVQGAWDSMNEAVMQGRGGADAVQPPARSVEKPSVEKQSKKDTNHGRT